MCNIIKFRSKFERGVIKTLKNMGEEDAEEQMGRLERYLKEDTLLDAYLRDKDELDMEGISFADWNTARIEILKEKTNV